MLVDDYAIIRPKQTPLLLREQGGRIKTVMLFQRIALHAHARSGGDDFANVLTQSMRAADAGRLPGGRSADSGRG